MGAAAPASRAAARRARSPALTNFDSKLRQALQALEKDPPREAVPRLREQLQHEPSNAGAYAALGIALAQMGEIPEALEALERAHYLQPESPRILYNYGLALEKAGRKEDARFRFAAAVKLDPLYEPAVKRLARGLGEERAPRSRELDAGVFGAADPAPPPRTSALASLSVGSSPPETLVSSPPPGKTPADPVTRPSEEAPEAAPYPLVVAGGNTPGAESAAVEISTPDPALLSPIPTPAVWADPEALWGLDRLTRATLQLWGAQPLVWVGLLAVPNAFAALVPALPAQYQWVQMVAWVVALAVGLAPALTAAASQCETDEPFPGGTQGLARRLLRPLRITLPYVLLTLGAASLFLFLRTGLPQHVLLLACLLLTAPFHALLAPALMLSVGTGAPFGRSLRTALRIAGRRTWVHMGLMVGLGLLLGAVLAFLGCSFTAAVNDRGDAVARTVQVAGLAIGESLWVCLLTICGLDALARSEPQGDT